MELYYKDSNTTLYSGDMNDVNNVVMDNSIDCIITDPPYELGFMGKSWDSSGIAFQKETWKHCFDVLKPGGHLLAFGGSRTFHRIACAIEDAGFEIRDTIMWVYGSGFPKSMDISKQLDKRNAKDFYTRSLLAKHIRDSISVVGKTKEDLLKRFNGSAKVTHWLSSSNTNFYQPNHQEYEILVDEFGCSWDYYVEEADREVVGIRKGCLNNWGGKNNLVDRDITIPSTDLAKRWNGWGTCLKPAYEPIIVARKPCDGSCADNVIAYGVGGINIDECRVPISGDDIEMLNAKSSKNPTDNYNKNETKKYGDYALNIATPANERGRFPSNLILTYDETDKEEVIGGFPETKSTGGSGELSVKGGLSGKVYQGGWSHDKAGSHIGGIGDEGSASRYFYCAKASKRDRDEGLQAFFEKTKVFNGKSKESSKSIKDVEKRFTTALKNYHPTVKPTSLMQYLIRLVSPKGATILDPFMGSGSTGKALMYENNDRGADYKFIGVELTDEYLPIAKARILFAKGDKEPVLDTVENETTNKVQEDTKPLVERFDFGV